MFICEFVSVPMAVSWQVESMLKSVVLNRITQCAATTACLASLRSPLSKSLNVKSDLCLPLPRWRLLGAHRLVQERSPAKHQPCPSQMLLMASIPSVYFCTKDHKNILH